MEPADTLQHLLEHLPRHSHLCQLKHQPPSMPHQMSTYLDELDLDTAQRPVLDRLRPRQVGAQKVSKIVRQACREHVEGMNRANRTWLATNLWQPRPVGAVQGILALLDSLLRSTWAIVEVHYALGAGRHVGDQTESRAPALWKSPPACSKYRIRTYEATEPGDPAGSPSGTCLISS